MSNHSDIPGRFNAASYFVDRHVSNGRDAHTAFECGEERVAYGDLTDRVNRLGNALRHKYGVRMEERVLLLIHDSPEFAYCFFGILKIGAVAVPVNTLLRPKDYLYIFNDSRARVAIVSESLVPIVQQIAPELLPYLQHTVVVDSDAPRKGSFSELIRAHAGKLEPASTSKDDVALWLYSSGSTGPPKACIHLHKSLVVTTELFARGVLKIDEKDRCFSVAKLFFAYGLGNGLYFPLSVGATSILLPGAPSPQAVYETIERHRPTLFFSVPSNYAALLGFTRPGVDFDLSSVRLAVSAGEALPVGLFDRFKARYGISILDGIGSTEALHIFISNTPENVRRGSSGRVLPGCEAKLLDEDGTPTRPGETGILWVGSEAICRGYWNQHERTKSAINGRWLCTDDRFSQDEDGYFWYRGRRDDLMKVSGVWVSPTEVENVLLDHESVAEAAVAPRKDRDELVKPVAYVVLREGFSGSPELRLQLQEFVRSRLAVYKRPRWVEFVSELPRTASGKIQRFRLGEALATFQWESAKE